MMSKEWRLCLRKVFTAIIMALSCVVMSAQEGALLTNYWAVPTYYNPAAVGDTDYLRLRGGTRLQWVGIDNAPRTFLATADLPFKFASRKWGVGVVAQRDSRDLYKNTTVNLQLGYKFHLPKGELTLALQGGYLDEQFKGSELPVPGEDDPQKPGDEVKPTHDVSGSAFDLGIGVNYSNGSSWLGLSLLHANKPKVAFAADGRDAEGTVGGVSGGEMDKKFEFAFSRMLYFTAGSNIKVKNTLLEVIPSMLVRTDFTFTDFELTGRLRYKQMFSAGIGYRYKDAVSIMLGAEFKGVFLGYSYDYNLNDIAKESSGSHEIFAGYSIKLDFSEKNRFKHKSIRIL